MSFGTRELAISALLSFVVTLFWRWVATQTSQSYTQPSVGAVELQDAASFPKSAKQPKKLAIVGVSGAGKSWLAKALSAQLGIKRIDLDQMLEHRWRMQARTDNGSDLVDVRHALREASGGWVADGVFKAAQKELWPRCHLIVVLDAPPALRVWRVLRRACLDPENRSVPWHRWLRGVLWLSWQACGMGPQQQWLLSHLATMQEGMAESAAAAIRKRAEQRAKGHLSKTSPVREHVPVLVLRGEAQVREWLESLRLPASRSATGEGPLVS